MGIAMIEIEPRFWPSWCLPADTTEETADRVFRTLDEQLKRCFGSVLQPTPGRTGLLAWRRLQETRRGVVGGIWPTLSPDLQTIIQETGGQGRFECCPVSRHEFGTCAVVEPCPGYIPNLYCLDMQLAYGAAAIHLQAGKEWRHEMPSAKGWEGFRDFESWAMTKVYGFLADTPGWYRVHYRVPEKWRHVGILPCRSDGGWSWPNWGEGETWASHHEVALAVECGWRVEILERIVAVVPEGVSSYLCPLRLWSGKLIEMRREALSNAPLLVDPIRNILLHAIGSFARGPKKATRTAAEGDAVPEHELARSTLRQAGGGWEYEDYAPSSGDEAYQHPEWTALIWGWTRARLLRGMHYVNKEKMAVGALVLPRDQVVGFALDCIYTTHNPRWPASDTSPAKDIPMGGMADGDFRVKWHVTGPLPAPRTMLQIYQLTGKVAE